MLHGEEREAAIDAAVALFPAEFGLKGFPGERFRVSRSASFMGDDGEVLVYTQRFCGDRGWLDFAKGTVPELQREVR